MFKRQWFGFDARSILAERRRSKVEELLLRLAQDRARELARLNAKHCESLRELARDFQDEPPAGDFGPIDLDADWTPHLAEKLARRFHVSVRTAFRDLEQLLRW